MYGKFSDLMFKLITDVQRTSDPGEMIPVVQHLQY